ncbi:MAG: SGNH/GDSL hydrolase family protein [Acidobacteria bacterium]|jgi:lysophospholipase L1-like esterase|nr:SGNH/GDSL hydrolase family protein [Acidobacteriota bacterium]
MSANLTLAVASLSVCFALLVAIYEVAANVRYYRWRRSFDNNGAIGALTIRSPNPTLLWEYRPNAEVDGIAINRWGFRDVDYATTEKPRGVRRIAFVGDSVTLGMGVPPQATFVSLVQTMAVASGHNVRTLNFGVDGYNALQIRELLTAKALAFDPDDVVYVLCLNDFDFSDSSGRKVAYFRRPWFFLPQDLARRYRKLRGREFHHDHFDRHRSDVLSAIGEMKEILDARAVGFLVVIVPVFPEPDAGAPGYFSHYPFRDIHRKIVASLEQRDIAAHDLLGDFERLGPRPDVYALDIWHLTEEGHRVTAESLWRRLLPGDTEHPRNRTATSGASAAPSP